MSKRDDGGSEVLAARAICAARCAFMGEPACHALPGDWPPAACDEPGCLALGKAAAHAMLSEREKGKAHD